ncbi:DUF6233 domain-containing protein [Streptomyces pratensis]|uniref:DUF6233 domain-containing protein n=1 Tax=Streptomyces pratensis TaxID=1169025 RepID=UPI00362B2B84
MEGPAPAVRRDGVAALGGCTLYSTDAGYISREDAMTTLAEPAISPCEICPPDTGPMS